MESVSTHGAWPQHDRLRHMSERLLTPELMDDPDIHADAHTRALAGLARLNRISLAPAPIAKAIRRHVPSGEITILDVACGSGDVAHAVYRKLQGRYTCRMALADISPHALELARARFAGVQVETHCINAICDELPVADVVICSLFLHHLEHNECVQLLKSMSVSASKLIVISDLRRSRHGTILAGLIPRLLTTSRVVHTDALKSASAAFTIPEIQTIASDAGLTGPHVSKILPSRLLLTWEPHE